MRLLLLLSHFFIFLEQTSEKSVGRQQARNSVKIEHFETNGKSGRKSFLDFKGKAPRCSNLIMSKLFYFMVWRDFFVLSSQMILN